MTTEGWDPKEVRNAEGEACVSQADAPKMLQLLGHDIRTAVSDVIGGIRLIDHAKLAPDTQVQFERIRIASETLAELMDSALTIAAGQDPGDEPAESLEFRSFLAEIELRWSGRAREQGLQFQLRVDQSVPERIKVARIKLDRILGNLVANALKFTDAGIVTLCVRIDGGDLVFRVRDEGQGFSDRALKLLFSSEGRPRDATRPGTGLGLHISKELAVSLGGDLDVVNLKDLGAIVTLTLPEKTWECSDVLRKVPDLAGLSILVAEDNETNQILVRQMLAAMGAAMDLACDGVEADTLLRENEYDLALIDIEMPRKSGIEVIRDMRAIDGFATPLVALTAYVMRDNREAIYAAGADGVIGKPIRSLSSFGDAIRRHTDRSQVEIVEDTEHRINVRKLAAINGNRFEAILQAAEPEGRVEFLTHLLADLKSIASNLRLAMAVEDNETVRAQTHILISLSGAIGAERMQAIAESLNATAHRKRIGDAGHLANTCQEALALLIDKVENRWQRAEVE